MLGPARPRLWEERFMAYTIDEVFANTPPTAQDEYDEVMTTVVITQEDSRTAYGLGWLAVDYAGKTLVRGINNADPAFDFYMQIQ
jgi:hypothetical protein